MSKKITKIAGIGAVVAATVGSLSASDSLTSVFRTRTTGVETEKQDAGKIRRSASGKFNAASPSASSAADHNVASGSKAMRRAHARIPAAANLADFPLLYGLNYRDDTWQTLSPLPASVFSFQGAAGMELLNESGIEIGRPMAACYGNGKFYVINSSNGDEGITTSMDVYDAKTWEKLDTFTIAENDPDWVYYFRQVAAIDPVSGRLFSVTWGDGKPLVSVDPATGEFTNIGQVNKFIQSLVFDDEGRLYGFGFNDKTLYSIDTATGEPTAIGVIDVPFNLSANQQSMVYDPARKKALWVAVNSNSLESFLYELSLDDAHAELIGRMPGNEHILGLYMPEAAAAAPAAPTAIRYADGKVCMTTPSATYTSGETLGGELTAYITTRDGKTTEATVAAGSDVEIPLALADGKHYLKVRLGNEAGLSPERRLDVFLGEDVPSAVTDLELRIDDGKTAVLTWNAPTTSVNGGAIPDSELRYRIVRWPDEVMVADGLTGTSFTDEVPEAHAGYRYEVIACAANRVGESAISNRVTAGEFWFAPYVETFDTQADFDSFKIIDANKDMLTWDYMLPGGMDSGYAYLHGNGTADVDTGIYDGNGNDDYLISPLARLKAGRDYRMSVETYDNWLTYEYLTILTGRSRELTGNEEVIFTTDKFKGSSSETFLFTVPEDGDYAFFFHADNPGQSVTLSLDNISLDEYAVNEAPAHVEGLTATAGDLGAMSNTLSFTTPTTTYKTGSLDAITEVRIYRNGSAKPCKVFDNPALGETLTWTDTEMPAGMNTYRVLAYNDNGQGEESLVSNWVGLDEPSDVTDFKLRMNADGKAEATFSPSTGRGKHGGYVDNSVVTYALFRYNEYNWTNHWEQATPFSAELSHTDADYQIWYGQQYVDYMLVASNEAGTSNGVINGIVLGTPYELPYSESFAYGFASQNPWTIFSPSYYYAWNIVTGDGLPVKPYDGDGGMMMFAVADNTANEQVIAGPRINISGDTKNELSFYMWHGFEAEPEDLELIVYLNYNDEGWTDSARVAYNNSAEGWARYAIPLREDAADVQIAFGAYAADASAAIYIDAIGVAPGKEKDMALVSTAISSKRVDAGDDVTISVAVANYGTETASGVAVRLMDGEEIFDDNVIETLQPNEVRNVEFVIPTDRSMASNTYSYTAEVALDGDADMANNAGHAISFYVKGSNLPAPENLAGAADGNVVELSWEKPSKSEVNDAVTDDFDSYESFIIDNIGDWTTYDGDGTPTVYFGGPEIPNCFSPKAWQVWAPEEAGFSLEKFDVLTPHSGTKYLTCWAASDGATTTLPNDDWLISSEVVGGSEVSFWYRMPNTGSDPQVFEMMYSATTNDPEEFEAFDSDAITFGTDWVYFEYTLPADARYFAIRSCSQGAYTVACLDDITYTPLYGSTTALTLEGYNLYRDNELIAGRVDGTSYTDTTAEAGEHVYHVTAQWAEGESNYSNGVRAASSDVTAVEGNQAVKVRGLEGIIAVMGAAGRNVAVYTPEGLMVAESRDGSRDSFAVSAGVYIVKVGNKAFKVRVK